MRLSFNVKKELFRLCLLMVASTFFSLNTFAQENKTFGDAPTNIFPAKEVKVFYEADKKFYMNGFDPANQQVIAEPSIFANTSQIDKAVVITEDADGYATLAGGNLSFQGGVFTLDWTGANPFLAEVKGATALVNYTISAVLDVAGKKYTAVIKAGGSQQAPIGDSEIRPIFEFPAATKLISGKAYLRVEIVANGGEFDQFGGVQDYMFNIRTSELEKTVKVVTPEGVVKVNNEADKGDTIIYTIKYTNKDNAGNVAIGVSVIDSIPTGTILLNNGGGTTTGKEIKWTVLPTDVTKEFTLKLALDAGTVAGTVIPNIAYAKKDYGAGIISEDNSASANCDVVEVTAKYLRIPVGEFDRKDTMVCANSVINAALLADLAKRNASTTVPVGKEKFTWYSSLTGAQLVLPFNILADTTVYVTMSNTDVPGSESTRMPVTISILDEIKITAVDTRPNYNFDCNTATTVGTGAIYITATGHLGKALQYKIGTEAWKDDFKSETLVGGTYTVSVRYKDNAGCQVDSTGVIVPTSVVSDTTSFSFGDAPVGYGLASHKLRSCLYFGEKPKSENVQAEAVHSLMANTAGNDDGLATHTLSKIDFTTGTPSYISLAANGDLTIKAKIANPSNIANVKAFAWLDLDQKDKFVAGDAIQGTISGTEVTFKWIDVKEKIRHGATYLRMRISSDAALTAAKFDGELKDGEVEDYMLDFDLYDITKSVETVRTGASGKIDTAYVGENVIYTLSLTNKLPYALTGNNKVIVTDTISDLLTYVVGLPVPVKVEKPLEGYNIYTWTIDPLAANSANTELKLTLKVSDKVTDVDTVHNIAYMNVRKDTLNSATETCKLSTVILQSKKLIANDDCFLTSKDKLPQNIHITANDTIKIPTTDYDIKLVSVTGTSISGVAATLADFAVSGKTMITAKASLTAGTYVVKYKLASTTASGLNLESNEATLTVTIVAKSDTTLCIGTTNNQLSVTNIPGVTFTWYKADGITPISATNTGSTVTYPDAITAAGVTLQVTASVAGCDSAFRMPYVITGKQKATSANLTVAPNPAIACFGETATITASTTLTGANGKFTWYDDAIRSNIVSNTATLTTGTGGTYYVTYSNDDYCENDISDMKDAVVKASEEFKMLIVTKPTECGTGTTGEITIDVEQGGIDNPVYTYSILPAPSSGPSTGSFVGSLVTIFNLEAKSYTVTITDTHGGCKIDTAITIDGGFAVDTAVARSYSDGPLSYGIAAHKIEKCVYLGSIDVNKIQVMPIPSDSANTAQNDDGVQVAVDANGYIDLNTGTIQADANGNLSVVVDATNLTSTEAYVVAWIDFEHDGTFGATDFVTAPIKITSTSGPVTLKWNGVGSRIRKGETYMRVRIAAEAIAAADVTKHFETGEVEDYLLNFNPYDITKDVKVVPSKADAFVGDNIEYTITIAKNVKYEVNINRVYDTLSTYLDIANATLSPAGNKSPVADSAVFWDNIKLLPAKMDTTLTILIKVKSIPLGVLQHTIYNIAYAKIGLDTINSATADCELTEIIIKPVPINADDDCAVTFRDSTVIVNILGNDHLTTPVTDTKVLLLDKSLTSIAADELSGVTKKGANVTILADSTLQYVPKAGFFGIDTLQYYLSAHGKLDTATIQVAVIALDIDGTKYTFCKNMDTAIMVNDLVLNGIYDGLTFEWYKKDGTAIAPAVVSGANKGKLNISLGNNDTVFFFKVKFANNCIPDTLMQIDVAVNGTIPYAGNFTLNVCPAPTTNKIELTSYVHVSEFYKNITWSPVTTLKDATTGELDLAKLVASQLYIYNYKLETFCGDTSAKAYVYVLDDKTTVKDTTTILVCYEDAQQLNLLTMLHLDAGGDWFYAKADAPAASWPIADPLSPVYDYITTQNGIFTGLFLDGYNAYMDNVGEDSGPSVGDKRLLFEYRIPASAGCLKGQTKVLEIILTNKLIP